MSQRILIVDDSETDRKIIMKVLQDVDPAFEIQTADSGEAALNIVKEFNPDLAFLDVNMPQDNGFDICQKIKEINPNLKVVILTGATDSVHYKRTVESQADGYINKNSIQKSLKITLNRIRFSPSRPSDKSSEAQN